MNLKKRFFAVLFDYCFVMAVMFLLSFVVAGIASLLGSNSYGDTEKEFTVIFTLVFAFFYYGQPFRKEGQTFGEKLMKFKVVPLHGEKISIWSALIRYVALAPLLAVFGLIVVKKEENICILETASRTRQVSI